MKGKKPTPPPAAAAESALSPGLLFALWALTFSALAFVPDQKILRYKLLAVEAGVWLLLSAAAASWAAGASSMTRTPLDIPVLLYGASGALFYLLSPERGVSRMEFARMLFCAAAFFAATQTWPRLREPRRALAAFSLCGGLLGVYSLLQLRGGFWILAVPQLDRPIATFGNPIFLAAFFLPALILTLGLLADPPTPSWRIPLSLSAALCAAGLWVAQSRAALAGAAAAGLLAALLSLKGRARAAAVCVVLAGLALAGAWFRTRQWTHGLIWADTLALWKANPFFGCGLGRFHVEFPAYASDALKALWPQRKVIINFAHNEYLQALAETGLLGFSLLGWVVGAFARWLWAELRDPARLRRLGGPALAAAALLAQAVFSPDLRFGVSSFVVFALMGAALSQGSGVQGPLPAFPGRLGCAALAGAFLLAWGNLALQPALAERRLSREPSFHVAHSPELEKAFAELEERLARDPSDGDAAENLGYLYAKEKRWPEAIEKYRLASRLLPDRPGPVNNLGNIYYSLGDLENAISYWKRSVALAPDQLDAHLNLGKSLYEVGRLKESSVHLQAVLKKDPANEKAQILLKKMVE
ncbi:MAG: tetratricopeptide repeat protein [Elusimicrobiota bacterium]